MPKKIANCCPRFCSRHTFCPPGECIHCDQKRGLLERVPVEFAEKNRDFYAVYYLTRRGVLRWITPLKMKLFIRNRYRNLGALPPGKTYFMAEVAVTYGRGKIGPQQMRLAVVG